MEVGQKYRVKPAFTTYKDGTAGVRMTGRVVWVHPKGRFAVLAFAGGVRECFYPQQLTAGNLLLQKKGR